MSGRRNKQIKEQTRKQLVENCAFFSRKNTRGLPPTVPIRRHWLNIHMLEKAVKSLLSDT